MKQDYILIKKIIKGDEKAFRSLYDLFFVRVVNFAFKFLHNRNEACEVAQDVFMKIWDMREELNENKSVSGFIFRITKLKSIDLIRKEESRVNLQFSDNLPDIFINDQSVDQNLIAEELNMEYVGIVNKLPAKRAQIFRMSRDECMTYKDISERLDISPRTVETQIRLALQQIKEDLSNHILISFFMLQNILTFFKGKIISKRTY
jgi:RNA polymerase sigma-70 factor (ECF subfamily)